MSLAEAIRVVHYLNQFFGGIGGEEQAYEPVQGALGDQTTIVGTLIAGDNYFAVQR